MLGWIYPRRERATDKYWPAFWHINVLWKMFLGHLTLYCRLRAKLDTKNIRQTESSHLMAWQTWRKRKLWKLQRHFEFWELFIMTCKRQLPGMQNTFGKMETYNSYIVKISHLERIATGYALPLSFPAVFRFQPQKGWLAGSSNPNVGRPRGKPLDD